MNQIVFLFLILVLALGLPLFLKLKNSIEGYSNYNLDNAMGNFPQAQTEVLVQDTYPPIGKNQISNDTASDIWWHYPIFKLGSYAQITNNIRYPDNPDEGTCMPASMCGALYHDNKKLGSNYITPLPPLNPVVGTRVGYFDTSVQLVDSLPYRTDMQNILY
jgi:hypothetical protein